MAFTDSPLDSISFLTASDAFLEEVSKRLRVASTALDAAPVLYSYTRSRISSISLTMDKRVEWAPVGNVILSR